MKLGKLIIRNFLSVQEADLVLADKGLVSIEGVNEDGTGADSNGSGKTSIMNAILWCNYNDCGKPDVLADSVVNDKAGKNCMVQCVWVEPKIQHRVTRYRKHKEFKNAVTVEVKHEDDDWMDITKTGKEIQQQINEILGQDLMTFKASCFAAQEDALNIPAMTDSALKNLLEKTLPFDELDTYHKKAKENLANQLSVIKEIEDKIQFNEILLTHKKDEGIRAAVTKTEWDSNVAKEDKLIDEKIVELRTQLKTVSVDLKKLEALRTEEDRLTKAIGSYNPILLNRVIYRMEDVSKYITRLNKQLTEDEQTVCPTCGQDIKDKESQKHHLEAELETLHSEFENLLKEKEKYEKIDKEFTTSSDKLSAVKRRIAELTDAEHHNDRINGLIAVLEAKKRAGLPNPYLHPLERLKAEFDRVKGKLKNLKNELLIEKEKLPVLEAVVQTFSPKGVRYHILEEITPLLNERTNVYLSQLTDNSIGAVWSTVSKTQKGEYVEKFSIDIKLRNLTEYGLLSGGEKRKVKLACFFALQDLIAKRATKNIDIWCGDEIDDALDTAGLERLMVLLDEKTKVKSTILVISHNDLRDWIPNHAIVTRKNNVSTITGYLNG